MKGEITYLWKVGAQTVVELECEVTSEVPSLTGAKILESALASACERAAAFAVPPKEVLMEIDFGDTSWSIARARWRDGGFVHQSGILAVGAPDRRVSVRVTNLATREASDD